MTFASYFCLVLYEASSSMCLPLDFLFIMLSMSRSKTLLEYVENHDSPKMGGAGSNVKQQQQKKQ